MDSNFEADLENLNDDALKYLGVTNLDFRSHLSKNELNEIKNIIFSINTLLQISFKDGTDVSDIENIKHLLELSPMSDDRKIEKFILRNNNSEEIKEILGMPYENPDTWHIAYEIKDGTYMLTNLPNYRVMEEYMYIVLSCVKDDMTPLEKIKEIYDFIKLIELDDNASDRLPDIIKDRKSNNLGFHLLFSELLKRIGINTFIGFVKREGRMEAVTLLYLDDEKYDAKGFYLFDPVSDSIPKDIYKSDAIRKVNYNFLALTFEEFINTKEDDHFVGALEFLNSDSLSFSLRHIDEKERIQLENKLAMDFETVFEMIKKTKRISDATKIKLMTTTVHEEDFLGLNRNIDELLTNNYNFRKNEIFKEEDSETTSINIHDI